MKRTRTLMHIGLVLSSGAGQCRAVPFLAVSGCYVADAVAATVNPMLRSAMVWYVGQSQI